MAPSEALTILVADRSEPAREKLGEALSRNGCTVFLAGNAASALEIIRTATPALVIADLRLPGMPGSSLLSRTRSLRPGTWRMLMASQHDWAVALDCLSEGIAHHYFTRSTDPAVIAASIVPFTPFPSEAIPDEAPRRILLVLDSLRQRRRLSFLLAPFGIVAAVENGAAALREARAASVGLVITAIDLDGIGGLDLIRILRTELGCTAPVIVWEERSVLDRPAAAGITDEATLVVERTDDHAGALLDEVRRLIQRPAPPRRKR